MNDFSFMNFFQLVHYQQAEFEGLFDGQFLSEKTIKRLSAEIIENQDQVVFQFLQAATAIKPGLGKTPADFILFFQTGDFLLGRGFQSFDDDETVAVSVIISSVNRHVLRIAYDTLQRVIFPHAAPHYAKRGNGAGCGPCALSPGYVAPPHPGPISVKEIGSQTSIGWPVELRCQWCSRAQLLYLCNYAFFSRKNQDVP